MKRSVVLMTRNLYWSKWRLTPLGEYINNTKRGELRLCCINQYVLPILWSRCWDLTVKKVALWFTAPREGLMALPQPEGSNTHPPRWQGSLHFKTKTLFLTQDQVILEKMNICNMDQGKNENPQWHGSFEHYSLSEPPSHPLVFVLYYSSSMRTHTSYVWLFSFRYSHNNHLTFPPFYPKPSPCQLYNSALLSFFFLKTVTHIPLP